MLSSASEQRGEYCGKESVAFGDAATDCCWIRSICIRILGDDDRDNHHSFRKNRFKSRNIQRGHEQKLYLREGDNSENDIR